MSNLWVTTPAWLDANPHAAEGFNLMWQEGVNAWWADKKTIIQAYPDMFTVKNQAELDWFLNYLDAARQLRQVGVSWTRPGSTRRRPSSRS